MCSSQVTLGPWHSVCLQDLVIELVIHLAPARTKTLSLRGNGVDQSLALASFLNLIFWKKYCKSLTLNSTFGDVI